MLYPVYNFTVLNGSLEHPWTNAKAPIHIVSGAAGCDEDLDPFEDAYRPAWSAFRASTYSYGEFTVHNHTHLHYEQRHANNGSVFYEVDIIRTDRA